MTAAVDATRPVLTLGTPRPRVTVGLNCIDTIYLPIFENFIHVITVFYPFFPIIIRMRRGVEKLVKSWYKTNFQFN